MGRENLKILVPSIKIFHPKKCAEEWPGVQGRVKSARHQRTRRGFEAIPDRTKGLKKGAVRTTGTPARDPAV